MKVYKETVINPFKTERELTADDFTFVANAKEKLDAARYRFLRDQSEVDLGAVGEPVIALPLSTQSGDYLSGKDADEAIDAAMERKRAKDAEFMNSTLTVPK